MTSRRIVLTIPKSVDAVLLCSWYAMKRSWCYKRIMLAIVCATLIFVLLKSSDNSLNVGTAIEDSYYQDTNVLTKRIEKIARRRKLPLNATGKYCYRTDDDYGETIVFIQFNNKWTDFDTCAVKTAAMFNPQTPICILHAGPESVQTIEDCVKGLNNVQVAALDVLEILDGTPLYDWYIKVVPTSTKRRYFHTELLDALRAGYLYKYGGTYLDTDVWTLRSLDTLPPNSLAKEASHLRYLSNFVMSFERRHSFMHDAVKQFNKTVNATRWGSGGPVLLTKLYEDRWGRAGSRRVAHQEKSKSKPLVHVIDAELFYPVHIGHGPIQFESASYDRVVNMTRDAYTIHLWREVYRSYWTGRSVPQRGSFVWTIYDQFCRG